MPEVRANGVTHYYELRGPAGAPVIAFSNSIGSTLEMWAPQVAAFTGRYRCLTYDTRGHGRSEVVDRPVTIDNLADDLAGLLDALGIDTAHVVGLSLGGMIAQAFALRHPARLRRLVLIATSAEMPRNMWLERAASVRRDGLGPLVDVTMSPRWFTPAFATARPDVIAPIRERFLATDPRGYAVVAAAIADLGLLSRIAAIAAPTLILAGAEDPSMPVAMLETVRSRIPGAEMVVIPGAAHLLTTEKAEIANAYVGAFLDRDLRRTAPGGGVSFEAGLQNRKAVLGSAHVERSLAGAGDFAMPWQDFITRMAWGEIWGDPTLPWKTRSLVTLAMMVALHREEEFKLHVRPALTNGVTREELRSLILQTAIYAGVPAGNAAMRWVRDVLGEDLADGAKTKPA